MKSVISRKENRLFYGYIIVAAGLVIMTVGWGANRTFGVFLTPMLEHFQWTKSEISGAFTLNTLVMGASTLFSGQLTRKYGPRAVLIGCAILVGAGYLLVSRTNSIWQFYLYYGVMPGIGMGGFTAPLLSTATTWFTKRRALMSGILTAGPAAGIVIIPFGTSYLISSQGWRSSYIVLGGLVLGVVTISSLFLRRDPSEMGFTPYGANQEVQSSQRIVSRGLSYYEAIRTPQFWLLCLINCCDMLIINVVVVFLVAYVKGLGNSDGTAASVLSVAAGFSIPSRILVGALADQIGNQRTLVITMAFSICAFALLLVETHLWALYLFAAIYGLSLWSAGSTKGPIVAEIFGVRSHATILSTTLFFGYLGGALGPVAIGYTLDVFGSFRLVFMVCLVVADVILGTALMLRPSLPGHMSRPNTVQE